MDVVNKRIVIMKESYLFPDINAGVDTWYMSIADDDFAHQCIVDEETAMYMIKSLGMEQLSGVQGMERIYEEWYTEIVVYSR